MDDDLAGCPIGRKPRCVAVARRSSETTFRKRADGNEESNGAIPCAVLLGGLDHPMISGGRRYARYAPCVGRPPTSVGCWHFCDAWRTTKSSIGS